MWNLLPLSSADPYTFAKTKQLMQEKIVHIHPVSRFVRAAALLLVAGSVVPVALAQDNKAPAPAPAKPAATAPGTPPDSKGAAKLDVKMDKFDPKKEKAK